jgi:hypothetical protein
MPKSCGPTTPAKTQRRTSSFQNSPFSDYFSDDARSSLRSSASAPSNETKALLVRMNKLQSQLMRDQSSPTGQEAIGIVQKKLREIELEVNALQSDSRSTHADSGIFIPEDGEAVRSPMHSRGPSCQSTLSSLDGSFVFSEDGAAIKRYKEERDWYLSRMQELLKDLGSVQAELRQRHDDFKELHDLHSSAMEEKEAQIERLQSENEGLRQDLGFEYSELLFLKLQMKSLEVDVDQLRDVPSHGAVDGKKREQINHILSEMDRWRTDSDWQDVESRFKRRRTMYGIPTSPIRTEGKRMGSIPAEDADWSLETVREGRGRVTSLTIKRTDSSSSHPSVLTSWRASSSETDVAAAPVPLSGTTGVAGDRSGSPPQVHSEREATAGPTRGYTESWTQTDFTLLPPLDEEDHLFLETDDYEEGPTHEDGTDSDHHHHHDDDCAVTSSSEADEEELYQDIEDDDETVVQEPVTSDPHKSAWKELWSSLHSFTGMPEEDDD